MARLPNMTSLRLFLQVAKTLSFSETARLANLSQPALSRTIRLLEEDLGVKLFDRNSRNVNLTESGAALVPTVERLTSDFEMAFRELSQTFEGLKGRVVVGTLPSVAADMLPKVIAEFQSARPNVEIVIRENLTGSLFQSLHDRLVDISITTPPPANSGLSFEPLFEDDYVLVCRPEDQCIIPDPAPWTLLRDFPFIAMEPRSSVRVVTDSAMARAGLDVPMLFECAQIATVGGLIAQGLGISLLPKSTLQLLAAGGDVTWRALEPPRLSRTIGVCSIADRSLTPAANEFRRLMSEMVINSNL